MTPASGIYSYRWDLKG